MVRLAPPHEPCVATRVARRPEIIFLLVFTVSTRVERPRERRLHFRNSKALNPATCGCDQCFRWLCAAHRRDGPDAHSPTHGPLVLGAVTDLCDLCAVCV